MKERQNPEGGVEYRMPDEPCTPERPMVNPGNQDLPRREFQCFAQATFAVGRDQTLRDKNDFCRIALGGTCDGVIVTERSFPGIEDLQAIEGRTIYRRGAAPCEIPAVITKN